MSMLQDDLAAVFADTALTVPVVVGASTYRGFKRRSDFPAIDDAGLGVLQHEQFVRMTSADVAAASIASGSSISVDGVTVTVRDVRRIGHGELMAVIYAKA